MSAKREVIVFGKHYDSISEVAREFSINTATLQGRLRRGGYKSVEEAVLAPINKKERTGFKKPVSINGKEYESIVAACKAEQISYSKVLQRLQNGSSVADAFSSANFTKVRTIVDGMEFDSMTDAADAYGVSCGAIRGLLRRGTAENVEDAIHRYQKGEVSRTRSKKVVVDGRVFTSVKEAAQVAGVTVQAISQYKKRNHASKEEAIKYYLNHETPQRKHIVIDGCKYINLKDAREKIGISYKRVMGYLKRHNCSREEAVEWCRKTKPHVYKARETHSTNDK